MNVVHRRSHLSDITKLGHFLLFKRKLSYDSMKRPSNVSIRFVKSFLKSYSFQETRASSTASSETNRTDKIILNIFGVAMKKKLKSRMVFSTQEKNSWSATLRYGCPQIGLSSEIIECFQETILDAATFSKLLLVMDNLFENLPNFQKYFWIPQMGPL